MKDAKQGTMMRDSVERIEWALHEILPDEESGAERVPPISDASGRRNVSASDRIDKIHAPE